MAGWWRLSATEAQKAILRGDLTVEEYVRSLLARIQKREPAVKAWVFLDPEAVLAEARRLDQIPPGQRGPLHGFAVGVKDVILTKDMPTAYYSPLFQGQPVQTVDAAPVITLRALGALLIGKTHTTEFAATLDGPPTRNPHNPNRTPGGSSSGSGAAVGDYQVPIALGTQTLGSVVRPGSYNGCYAFKPTWGAISREGLAMSSLTLDTCGFFAQSVADLEALADAFKLVDDTPVPAAPFALNGARVGFCTSPNWPSASPALQTAWERARALLRQKGAAVEDVSLPEDFAKVPEWHRVVSWGEGRSSFLGQYHLGKDKLHARLAGYIDAPSATRSELVAAYDGCARLRPIFDGIASRYDVVITPSAPDEAPEGMNTGDGSFCLTWTMLHVPVVNVPGFAGSTGLPLGISLVGPRYSDRSLLHAAAAIGKVFEDEGGWKHNLF